MVRQTAIPALALALALLAVVGGPAAAQSTDVAALAVLANDVNHEYCAEIYLQDVALAARGYQKVAEAWETVDLGYRDSGDSSLLYWRGVLAQCLGQQELAGEDLGNFVRWTEGVDDAELAAMVSDAEARMKRLDTTAPVTTARPSRRKIGAALLVSGGGITVTGFAVNLVAYQQGRGLNEEDPYQSTRNAGIAGLIVGFSGVGVVVTGLLMAVLPERDAAISLSVGPVTSFSLRF